MATFGNLKRRIKRDVRARDGLRLSEEDIDDAVNDAIQHYEHHRFFFNEGNAENGLGQTITTVAGTASYAFPSLVIDLDEVLYLDNGDLEPLTQISWHQYRDETRNPTTFTGVPDHYALHGGWIYFDPTPDEVTTVTLTGLMRLTPTPLSLPSHSNGWTTHGLALIKARACWDLSLNALANPDRAVDFKTAENDALTELIGATNLRTSTGSAYVPYWDRV